MLRRRVSKRQLLTPGSRPLSSITGVIVTLSRLITLPARTPSPSHCTSTRSRICAVAPPTYSGLHTALRIPRASRITSQPFSIYQRSLADRPNHAIAKMPNTPEEIIAKLSDSFDKARDEGDLLFFPSTVHNHKEYGVEVCKSPAPTPDLPSLQAHWRARCSGRSVSVQRCRTSLLCLLPTLTQRTTRRELHSAQKGRRSTHSRPHISPIYT